MRSFDRLRMTLGAKAGTRHCGTDSIRLGNAGGPPASMAAVEAGEVAVAAIPGGLCFFVEETSRQLVHAAMIGQTFATVSLAGTTGVGTVAVLHVLL